jgi:hypothetical protein
MTGKKCPPGCTCPKHSPERRQRLSEQAKAQAAREGPEQRAAQVRKVWAGRDEPDKQTIMAKVHRKTRGKRADPEAVAKRADANRRTWASKTPEERLAHVQPALAARGRHMSRCEVAIAAALVYLEVPHEREVVLLGRYVVDFLVGTLVIEVDGAYWHDPERDEARDLALSDAGYLVVRIPEERALARPVQEVVAALLTYRRGAV